jgi:hypothetical protein
MRKLSGAAIDRLIHYDPAHAMAFVAVSEHSGKILGVVRLHDDPAQTSAEFAVLVRSSLKAQRMIEFAKAKNLKVVHGQVLSEKNNAGHVCRLGFSNCQRFGRAWGPVSFSNYPGRTFPDMRAWFVALPGLC